MSTPAGADTVEAVYEIDEIAAHLRCGRTKVYELIRAKELKSTKIGGLRRVRESWLKEYISGLPVDDDPDIPGQRQDSEDIPTAA